MKTLIFPISCFLFFIGYISYLIKEIVTAETNEDKIRKYKKTYIGKKTVIAKDTLIITDIDFWNNDFILSNGTKVDINYITNGKTQ